MDPLTIAAAAGSRARLESLDMLANNIANSSTAGFKADREFYGLYLSSDASQAAYSSGTPAPTDIPEIQHYWTDYSQGSLASSSNPLDLAIAGKGFFEINTANGPRWTRNGSFRIGPNGKLETQDGDAVSVNPPPGKSYLLDANRPLFFEQDGKIIQDGEWKGTVQLKMPIGQSQPLEKVGSSYFKVDPSSQPAYSTGTQIRQGFIETANTGVADAAVRLVSVMRQFEALQKATSLGSDMNKKAIDEVGRIGN